MTPLTETCDPNKERQDSDKTERKSSAPSATAPSINASEVVEIWNQAASGTNLPSARLTEKRERVIHTRLKEAGWLEEFRVACSYIRSSKFHRGENDRNWVANLDYLLQAGKATELAEKAKAKSSSAASGKVIFGDVDRTPPAANPAALAVLEKIDRKGAFEGKPNGQGVVR